MATTPEIFSPRKTTLKVLALLSTIRWYNILLTVVAQYLGAYFLSEHTPTPFQHLVLNTKLHLIVLSSVFSIAAGFIINNFYDYEKDLINRPAEAMFHGIIRKSTILNLYIAFNSIALVMAMMASFRIFIFFFCFIAALWVYSHKLQRIPFIKEFSASLLSVTSFFSIGLHYGQWYNFIFAYGVFFLSLVFTREIIKDFENMKGDTAVGNNTLLLYLGAEKTKGFVYLLMVFSLMIGAAILFLYRITTWNYYVLVSASVVAITIILFQQSDSEKAYSRINLIYKILLIAGVLNILMFAV